MNARAVLAGLVTAAAISAVLGSLDRYQVPDYADRDVSLGLAGVLIAVTVAVAVIAVAGPRPRPRHVLVPLALVPSAVLPLVLGAERNRTEAALIWGFAAVTVHVLLGAAPSRRLRVAGIAVVCAAAVLATWGCQQRWRAQKFEAVGVPLVVPQIPGHRLTGVWAGRYSVGLTLSGPSGAHTYAVIERRRGGCPATDPELLCLRDDAVLRLIPAGPVQGLVVREVGGATLAALPDDASTSEPD